MRRLDVGPITVARPENAQQAIYQWVHGLEVTSWIRILVAGTALAVLLIVPAVPQAAHAAKARRAEALRLREEDRKRREEEAKERQRQAQQIWHDTPDLGVYREYLRFEAQVRQPRQKAADEANRLLGQANDTVSRHQSTFRDGKPPKAGYQLLAMAGLVAFAFVFILGAALDYLIFRASHPGNVLLPLGLACIAMIGITVGSILAFGVRRHDLLPDPMSPYFRNMARLFGMMLAVGIAGYMVYIAPNRSYQAWGGPDRRRPAGGAAGGERRGARRRDSAGR